MEQNLGFQYYLSHELDVPVSLKLGRLVGCLPQFKHLPPDEESMDVDVFVEAEMAVDGHPVGSKLSSPLAPATREGAAWDSSNSKSQLTFFVKYKHLLAASVLGVTVWAQSETEEPQLIGSAVIPLFSKRGRLKCGLQSLSLVTGSRPDLHWPSSTSGKRPVPRGPVLQENVPPLQTSNNSAPSVDHSRAASASASPDRASARSDVDAVGAGVVALTVSESPERGPSSDGAAPSRSGDGGTPHKAQPAQGDGVSGLVGPPGGPGVSARDALAQEVRRLDLAVKRFQRGEMAKVPWLDGKTMRTIHGIQQSHALSQRDAPLCLLLELPSFPAAALYSHPQMQKPLAEAAARDSAVERLGRSEAFLAGFVNILDPEVTRGPDSNPCEYKALKLGRSIGKMEVDADAKPNKDELRVLQEILALPPSRHLTLQQSTMLWKFRIYLTAQPRMLVRFLRTVDWADAQEAHIAIENMRKWQGLDVEQALQMLTSDFDNVEVRTFAVDVLRATADDDKLLELMIQLVQCVRYDPKVSEGPSPVADFLVERCHTSRKLAVALHWSLIVDCEAPNLRERISAMMRTLYGLLREKNAEVYHVVHDQVQLKAQLKHFTDVMRRQPGSYAAREEFMRAQLAGNGAFAELASLRASLPEDPYVFLVRAIPDAFKIFKSARAPVRMAFETERDSGAAELRRLSSAGARQGAPERAHADRRASGSTTKGRIDFLFKDGDDLRQDQFICQLIKIMDKLLKRENLDLRLSPYWVLPISPSSGLIQFMPSTTLQEVTSKGGGEGIIKFLASHRSGGGGGGAGPPTVPPEAMENFVRSTAGYAVISYLLDLGDRHLENLLLTDSGKLFHIDFGYVFGMRDPKPWAKVPMSIKPQLVAAMGGTGSEWYRQFRQLACEAYCILRKHASFFLTLLKCMAGSAIDCFAASSNSVSLDFAMSQLEERLTMGMTDDGARDHIFALLDQSVNHILARVGDDAHRIASQLR